MMFGPTGHLKGGQHQHLTISHGFTQRGILDIGWEELKEYLGDFKMPWLECPLCSNITEVQNEKENFYCYCQTSSSKGQLMRPAPWDRYSDEKLWAMFAAHAPIKKLFVETLELDGRCEAYANLAAKYADELLKCHKQRWEKNL